MTAHAAKSDFIIGLLSVLTLPITRAALAGIPFHTPQNGRRMTILLDSIEHWPAHMAAHVTMLHGVVPNKLLPSVETAFIGQAWNISTEFQFYLIAPAVAWLLTRRGLQLAAGLLAIAAIAGMGRYYPNTANLGKSALYFGVGIVSFYVIKNAEAFLNTVGKRWIASAALMFTIVVLAPFQLAISLWLTFLLSTMPFYMGLTERRPLRLLASPIMLLLGRLSYSIYLSHIVVMYLVIFVLNETKMDRISYFVILLFSTAAGAVALAYLINRFVEVPFGRLGQSDMAPAK